MATRYAVVELEFAHSTQDEARDRYERLEPVLVIAGRQTAGRGRLGRDWLEPDRGMFASLVFMPEWSAETWRLIPLVAGLAARSAIESINGVSVDLGWPNDLMVGDGKVGGLLAESSEGIVVVGCGINLLWAEPLASGAALYRTDPGPAVARDLATAWADRLLDSLACGPDDWGFDEYRRACVTIGRSVSYAGGSGVAVGVSDEGLLVVETASGAMAVDSGEVRLHDRATLPTERRT